MTSDVASEIDTRGGPAAFAAAVNQKPGTVRQWRHRGIFPRSAWPEIISAFPDLTLERLKELEAAQADAGEAAA